MQKLLVADIDYLNNQEFISHFLSTACINAAPNNHLKKQNYFAGRILLANTLNLTKLPSLKTTTKGKPVFDGIEFNLSHSKNLVMLTINSSAIGCDIELVKPLDFYKISNKYFHLKDTQNLGLEQFFKVWTMREAYLKQQNKTVFFQDKLLLNENFNEHLNVYLRFHFLTYQQHKFAFAIASENLFSANLVFVDNL